MCDERIRRSFIKLAVYAADWIDTWIVTSFTVITKALYKAALPWNNVCLPATVIALLQTTFNSVSTASYADGQDLFNDGSIIKIGPLEEEKPTEI